MSDNNRQQVEWHEVKVGITGNSNLAISQPNNQTAPIVSDENMVKNAIIENAKSQKDIKAIIDLVATNKALECDGTVDKLIREKTDELEADAEAKRIESETARVRAEVDKIKQEGEKEIAEIQKEKDALEAEVDKLRELDDKAQAFFDMNKSILRCVGIRQKLSLKVMVGFMVPATFLFMIFQIFLLPLALLGFIVEAVTEIIGSLCGSFSKNGIKIVTAIVSLALITALLFGVYWLVANYAFGLF